MQAHAIAEGGFYFASSTGPDDETRANPLESHKPGMVLREVRPDV
jgi:hypothetical protein